MNKFEQVKEIFGDVLPSHPSEFFSKVGGLVTPAEIKKYSTGNNVRAYNIFKDKYYEFLKTIPAPVKEPTLAEKLALAKQERGIETPVGVEK